MKWFSDLSEGAASSLLGQNLTANKALISDANGKVAASDVDASKVGFLSGVTSDVQEQINSLSSAMESVNRAQTALTMSPAYLNTVDLINNYHNSYSNNLPDNTWYRYMANQRVAGGMLGGGYWYIEGVKTTKDWEWQMARSYLALANGGLRYRTKQAGVWQPWEMVQ